MGRAFNASYSLAYPVYEFPGGGGGEPPPTGGGGGGGGGGAQPPPIVPPLVDPSDPAEGVIEIPPPNNQPVDTKPTVPVPTLLLSNIAFNRAPAFAIYAPEGVPESGDLSVSGANIELRDNNVIHTIAYQGKSIKEIVEAINTSSQKFYAVELNQVPQVQNGFLFMIQGDNTPDGGQVVRLNGHVVRYQEETRLRLLPPYPDDRSKPWYARINTGQVLKKINGMRHLFAVPEYSDQPWSTYFGKPYVTLTDVRVEKLSHTLLRVPRAPIYWWDNNLVLTVKNIQRSSSIVKDVDQENGLIYLKQAIEPQDPVLATYTYQEKSFVYKGLNLNPSPDHLPQFVGQHVVFFLRPHADSLGRTWDQTVFHSIAPTLQGAVTQIPVKDDEPIMLLGALQVRQSYVIDDIKLVDTRTRGGGLKKESVGRAVKLNRAMQSISDQGTWDGIPYPGNAVVVIDLPNSLLDAMTKDEIYRRLKKEMAYGIIHLVNFRD